MDLSYILICFIIHLHVGKNKSNQKDGWNGKKEYRV